MAQEKKSSWKDLMQGFVVNMLEHMEENITLQMHKWITQLKRRAIGSVFMAVGITFFLNSIALYINAMTQDMFPWLGYSAVGLVTIFAGYVMLKE